MKTTSRSNRANMLIIICFIIIGILVSFICVEVYNKIQDNKKAKIYEESFTNGVNVGAGINYFDLKHEIGLISETQYEAFKIMRDKFCEDPSFDNFDLLAHIIMANLKDCEPLIYGEDMDGFLDGIYVGDTKTSVEVIHRNWKMSNEVYEDFLVALEQVLDHPTHEKVEIYTQYVNEMVTKLKG